MKYCKEGVAIDSIEPLPDKYAVPRIAAEDLLNIQQSVYHSSRALPPMKLYNIGQFYTEKGPLGKWDANVEKVTTEIGKNIATSHGHVIKERILEDKSSSYKTMEKKKALGYQVAKVTKMPQSSQDQERKKALNGIHGLVKKGEAVNRLGNQGEKQSGDPANKPASLAPKTQLVEQMKQLKREQEDQDMDVDGPYDFRRLLRRTDFLPTNTLRQFRERRKIPVLTSER
jgi:hypothetical protein